MTNTHLEISIDSETGKAKITCFGDMAKVARAIIRLARHEEELAVTLNTGMILLRDDLQAIEIRNKMIGMIQNPEQ